MGPHHGSCWRVPSSGFRSRPDEPFDRVATDFQTDDKPAIHIPLMATGTKLPSMFSDPDRFVGALRLSSGSKRRPD